MAEPIRIANCSGFYGDRLEAAREMVEGGPIDVLTGDYLAELTMLILWKSRLGDPDLGYAKTFLTQMEHVLGTCQDRGIKVVTNAGGLNPRSCADRVRKLAADLGLTVSVAHIEGDDLMPRMAELQAAGETFEHLDTGETLADRGINPITANAYLGAWGIVDALSRGADVVVCPRVTDASVVVGPAAWHHGWARDDWDALAGAVVAGHVIECGAQATGGNYAFFKEIPGLEHPGFPIAEIAADGSSVITKHDGTGGAVTIGTVTAQLLYEIGDPAYANPDVVARFDTIALSDEGNDRVRIWGVRGEPAPLTTKVCINYVGGNRNSMTFVLTGLDIEEKADLARRTLFERLGGEGAFAEVDVRLIRSDKPDAPTNEEAVALLRVTVKDQVGAKVGRAFTSALVEMALASYPGFTMTAPPGKESLYGVYWPALIDASKVDHAVVGEDGTRTIIPPSQGGAPTNVQPPPVLLPTAPTGPTRAVPLGALFGARSGDKGGNANVGVWARSPEAFVWLRDFLTVERFKQLLTESEGLTVERYELPNIFSLNLVVKGLLGEGVSSSTRFDPQAKGLGEYLRSRVVDIPESLL